MLVPYKTQVRIRFTITADDDAVLGFWEPGASSFAERMECLELAYTMGFETSVSIEPMLDPTNIERLVATLTPFVRRSIWIGKLNAPRSRVQVKNASERAVLERLLEQQSDAAIMAIYARLKQHPLVQWKESIKKVVGLPLAEKPGEGE
jgi:DNA repair photolyase